MALFLDRLLGLHVAAGALIWGQIAFRTVIVFIFGVTLIRLAVRRFIGRNAGFDVFLAVILGSVLSRAINGQAPFFSTLGASVLLVLLHRLAASLSCRWSQLSRLIKGDAILLVKDGVMRRDEMRRTDISEDDLLENIRLNANVGSVAEVAEARLERNGNISVVKRGSA